MNAGDAAELQREIRAGIPLSTAMGFEITALDDNAITVTAPLALNINVHATGFAGSLYALGILTGWGMVRHLIRSHGLDAALVVADARIRYRAPVRDDIECRCFVPDDRVAAFVTRLRTDGRARLDIEVAIGRVGEAVLDATMVAKTASD